MRQHRIRRTTRRRARRFDLTAALPVRSTGTPTGVDEVLALIDEILEAQR